MYSPGQLPLAVAEAVQDAVTTTLSGIESQLGNAEGFTVRAMVSGALDCAFSVTGATDGLQVNESGALPEVALLAENFIMRGCWLQVITKLLSADAK